MRGHVILRAVTLSLAGVHLFPATKHLSAFASQPSIGEAWKGLGATIAVILYLLPSSWQARALVALWRRRRFALGVASLALAAAHLVPALDHVPRVLASFTWGDAWRAVGSTFAVVWFTLPAPMQSRALRAALRATSRREARVAAPRLGDADAIGELARRAVTGLRPRRRSVSARAS